MREDRPVVHVISKHALQEFWRLYPDAEAPLAAWFKLANQAHWQSPADVRAVYRTVDFVGRLTVFNIGGNKYRLIARVAFEAQRVYVRSVLTHAEYDREGWKNDPWL